MTYADEGFEWIEEDYDELPYPEHIEPWCELHDRPHVIASLACEVYSGEIWAGTS
jgi:hypothetical protein